MANRSKQSLQRAAKRKTFDSSDDSARTERQKQVELVRERVAVKSEDLPRRSLEDALQVARILRETFGKVGGATWEEIASILEVASTTRRNKYPLWAAIAYGIVTEENGKYSLSERGRKILAPNFEGESIEGSRQAIQTPSIPARFYSDYAGSPIPPDELALNVLESRYNVPRERCPEALALILENARYANILHTTSDGKRTFSQQPMVAGRSEGQNPPLPPDVQGSSTPAINVDDGRSLQDYASTCFVITPIKNEGDAERKHADTILKHLITPVLKEFDLDPVRADRISKPGIITQQIVEHLARSRLCIADLSFENANAFYELGVRHVFGLPTIQIIRTGDKIPFDVSPGRTILVDKSDPYTIMDKFESARNELREHVKTVLDGASNTSDNPISYYLPGIRVHLPKSTE